MMPGSVVDAKIKLMHDAKQVIINKMLNNTIELVLDGVSWD